jgi:hypothetical protein
MDRKWLILFVLTSLIGIVLLTGCVNQQPAPTPSPTPTVTVQPTASPKLYSQAEADAMMQWRQLWEDHILWTRMVIMNIADTPGGTNESVIRLLRNYNDMEDAMRPYYGNETSEKFGDLIEEHLIIAADLVKAAKAGNSTAAAALEKDWYANADEIATLLSSTNPNWDKQAEIDMWHNHLAATKEEAVARLSGNYTADVAAFDKVHEQALMMADMQSGGIIRQFPDKFTGPKIFSQKEIDLNNGMRKLWTDHTVWTRMYIIESLNDSPATGSAAGRLLKNQEDIGNAIKPVYGDAAGTQLTGLLKTHITTAVAIIDDVKAGNSTAQAADEALWTKNADDISTFLAGANPNWPLPVLKSLMYMHLSTTKDELVARYTMNYPADVQAYDVVYAHILKMSDALSDGIVKQFPAMF